MHPGPYNPPPGAYPPPGPYGRNVPRYGHPGGGAKRGGCSCMKWMCCCYCSFFMTGMLILTGICVSYAIIKPQISKYNIDGFEVMAFNISDDLSLESHVIITVKADNPNKYIEIIYGKGREPSDNSLQILYSNVVLSSGSFPEFTQPKSNVTMIKIDLKGDLKKSDWAGDAGQSLAEKLKNNEKIPLVVQAKLPVNPKLGAAELPRPLVVSVNANMNVKNFAAGKKADISDPKYDFGLYIGKSFFKLPDGELF